MNWSAAEAHLAFDEAAPLLHVESGGRAWMFDLGDSKVGAIVAGSAPNSHILLGELPACCFAIERVASKLVLLTSYVQGLRLNYVKVKHQVGLIHKQRVEVAGQVLSITLVSREQSLGLTDIDHQTVSIRRADFDAACETAILGSFSYVPATEAMDTSTVPCLDEQDTPFAPWRRPTLATTGRDEESESREGYDDWHFDDLQEFFERTEPAIMQPVLKRALRGWKGLAVLLVLLLCSVLVGALIASRNTPTEKERGDQAAQLAASADHKKSEGVTSDEQGE